MVVVVVMGRWEKEGMGMDDGCGVKRSVGSKRKAVGSDR